MPRIINVLLVTSLILIPALILTSCSSESGPRQKQIPDIVDFNFHIKPILSDRCFTCHGPDANTREAGLRLDTEDGAFAALGEDKDHHAIVPGIPDSSTILDRLTTDNPDEIMPPPASNLTVTEYEVALIRRWIEQGAQWKKHWAFTKPERPEVPAINNPDWANNPIDNFVARRLQQESLQPSPEASPEVLLRRAKFDITGLPPTIEELDAFLNDESPDAYEKALDRFFASPDYGENMAIDWLDASRYADSHGYQDDLERTMWPWRDWVIKAFNENMPYDKFVKWQLAGDLLPEPSMEQLLATGFNRNHKITQEGGVIDEEYRVEYVADRTHTTGTIFLGLTMECARCHDHKYDPLTQKDYFEMFAFFNNVPEQGVIPYGDESKAPKPKIKMSVDDASRMLPFITELKDLDSLEFMIMEDMKEGRQAYILGRGQYDNHQDSVSAGTPSFLPGMTDNLPRNRLGFAEWLISPENPLTARVAVNRIWQSLFGTGIVSTPDDFGNQGALPTHPELLDWLAVEFRESGWNVQGMQKLIMMSAVYRQKSVASEEHLERDPENQLLARGPRYRLPAELIRDNALAVSGLLVKKLGGPSVKPYQPEGLWAETTSLQGLRRYVIDSGDKLYRKSLYTFWKRTLPPPAMMTFDAAARDLCSVKRQKTSTPLQALVLLNDPQIIEASRVFAEKLLKNEALEDTDKLKHAFRKITSRLPDEQETQLLHQILADNIEKFSGAEEDTKAFLAVGEATYDEDQDLPKLAALTVAVSAIFNTYEAVMKS